MNRNMAWHRAGAQVVEFHSELDRFLHLSSSNPLTGGLRTIHCFITNFVCLLFRELWDLQLGSAALWGSSGGTCDARRACSPEDIPGLLGLPWPRWGWACARALRYHREPAILFTSCHSWWLFQQTEDWLLEEDNSLLWGALKQLQGDLFRALCFWCSASLPLRLLHISWPKVTAESLPWSDDMQQHHTTWGPGIHFCSCSILLLSNTNTVAPLFSQLCDMRTETYEADFEAGFLTDVMAKGNGGENSVSAGEVEEWKKGEDWMCEAVSWSESTEMCHRRTREAVNMVWGPWL